MLALDQCYVVLSGFMLHRYASYLFSCTRKWNVSVTGLDLIFRTRMWSVYKKFRKTIPSWPPDGYIIMIGVFMSIIVFHSAVLFVSVFQIIAWNFRKFILSLDHLFTRYQYVLRGIIRFSSVPKHLMGLHIKQYPVLLMRHIYVSVCLSTDDMDSLEGRGVFDSDSCSSIVDNSANTHVWSIEKDFVPGTLKKLEISDSTGVATIGGVDLSPHSIGDVKTSWYDDYGEII